MELNRAELEAVLGFLEELRDEGPEGEGWRSDKLIAITERVRRARDAAPLTVVRNPQHMDCDIMRHTRLLDPFRA